MLSNSLGPTSSCTLTEQSGNLSKSLICLRKLFRCRSRILKKKGASTLHNVRIRTPWVERPGAVGSTIRLYYHLYILAWIYSKMLYIRGLDFYTLYNCMFRKGCYSSFSKNLISLFWVLHLQFPHIRSWNFSLVWLLMTYVINVNSDFLS